MAIVGDLAGFKRAQKAIERAAKQDDVLIKRMQRASVRAIKDLVKQQFRQGIGPDGSANRQTKTGERALKSEKLGRGALDAEVVGSAVRFYVKAEAKRWDVKLAAHQTGVVFPPRKAGGQWLRYNAKGRLISYGKFLRKTKNAGLGFEKAGYQSFVVERTYKSGKTKSRFVAFRQRTADHVIGRRVLPSTPIYPIGDRLPPRWQRALDDIARRVLKAWGASVTTGDARRLDALTNV